MCVCIYIAFVYDNDIGEDGDDDCVGNDEDC